MLKVINIVQDSGDWLEVRQVMGSEGTQANEINGWWIQRCTLYYYTCNSTIFFQIIKYYMLKTFKPLTQSTLIIHDHDRGQHLSGDHWKPGTAPII